MKKMYREGRALGRQIQQSYPSRTEQQQKHHAMHCAINYGYLKQQDWKLFIQGYLKGYKDEFSERTSL